MKKPRPARPGEINYPFMDRFTLAHFAIGVIYGRLALSWWLALTLAVFWELIENPLKAYCPRIFPHATADTWQNSLGDCVAVMAGWALVSYLF